MNNPAQFYSIMNGYQVCDNHKNDIHEFHRQEYRYLNHGDCDSCVLDILLQKEGINVF